MIYQIKWNPTILKNVNEISSNLWNESFLVFASDEQTRDTEKLVVANLHLFACNVPVYQVDTKFQSLRMKRQMALFKELNNLIILLSFEQWMSYQVLISYINYHICLFIRHAIKQQIHEYKFCNRVLIHFGSFIFNLETNRLFWSKFKSNKLTATCMSQLTRVLLALGVTSGEKLR